MYYLLFPGSVKLDKANSVESLPELLTSDSEGSYAGVGSPRDLQSPDFTKGFHPERIEVGFPLSNFFCLCLFNKDKQSLYFRAFLWSCCTYDEVDNFEEFLFIWLRKLHLVFVVFSKQFFVWSLDERQRMQSGCETLSL